MLATADGALHLSLVSHYFSSGQVSDERLTPITTRCRNYQDQLLGRGRLLDFLLLINGWHVEILDEDTGWNYGSGRPEFR